MNSDRMYPALFGDHVVVRIPVGLPALASAVAKQVLRNPAASKLEAYSIVADYLENLIQDPTLKDDVIDLVTRLNKTDAERYIDGMMESGYTVEELDQLARVIQRAWRKCYKSISNVERSDSKTAVSSQQSKTEFLDEIDYEDDSDDMERVNVVKKGQRDYVPPIPDFIDDQHSINSRSSMNVLDEIRMFSIEEE